MNNHIYGILITVICISLLYINNLYIKDLEKSLSINKEISDTINNNITLSKKINIYILGFTIFIVFIGILFNIYKKKN